MAPLDARRAGRCCSQVADMKITVTMEDTADGGVFITFDPSVAVLLARAARPDQCTAAEGYAFEVLTTIKRVADVAAREMGCTVTEWDARKRQ